MKVDKRMVQSSDVPEIIEFMWSSSVGKLLEHSAEKELLSCQWTDLSVQQGFKLIESPFHQSVEHEEDDKMRRTINPSRRNIRRNIEDCIGIRKRCNTLRINCFNSRRSLLRPYM
jgi:hypothetical protein